MSHFSLCCTLCGASHAADMTTLGCADCGSPLEVRYTEDLRGRDGSTPPLPLHDLSRLVSLGEGHTPCVELPRLSRMLGVRRLFVKLESSNPSGSFKDRGSAILMSVAREMGVEELVEDSSGNAGASVAAYAARAGIKAHIFAPISAPTAKLGQIKVYGAEAHLVEGSREAATEAAIEFYSRHGLVYASHNLSPYFIEGTKSFAYEVVHQLPDGPPDHLVFPVGNGSLFLGNWKGLNELLEAGSISEVPRLYCVQSQAVRPIAAAFMGEEWSIEAGSATVAGGVAVAEPPRKKQVLDVLQVNGGTALAVEDKEILRWQKLLAATEGVYGEPTSAAALAGLEELVRRGDIGASETVLLPITGSGLKDSPPD